MSLLEIASRIESGHAAMSLRGELDLSTVSQAEDALLALEREAEGATVVLDLHELSFMDSSGLRFVVAADVRAALRGRPLTIVRGPESVHRVFRLASLEDRLRFVDAPERARFLESSEAETDA